MMNRTDYLLTCLMEECGELIQECSKALRFGLQDKWEEDPKPPDWREKPTPHDAIIREYFDIVAVMDLLRGTRVIASQSIQSIEEMVNTKKQRIDRYMHYSEERGRFNPIDDSGV